MNRDRLSGTQLMQLVGKRVQSKNAPLLEGQIIDGVQFHGDHKDAGYLPVVQWPDYRSVVSVDAVTIIR